MVFAGVHKDKEEPPWVPMFGGQRKCTSTTSTSTSGTDLAEVLTGVAVAIKDAFSPDSQREST